ncbi:histone-lysine N-methyltransferase SETMAR [Elysia marginata]|uniref:Histone-lysine N-methyltransferase SETMAR n=1 Tax=Elysia marginata TaxID=1093978 RepID=A0AAV4HPR6_9GAST|nr:histone-lysine N-methyltransferase SETMAR [Elysia marginata]
MQRKTTCAKLLKHYEEEGEEFIQRIVTKDESWIHPESKRHLMEYRYKSSPSLRKFKIVVSTRKVMLTVFWDSEGIVHIEFLKQGNTVNSERPDLAPGDFYLFLKLKEHLRRNHYESDEDVEAAVRHWFRQKCVDFSPYDMRQLANTSGLTSSGPALGPVLLSLRGLTNSYKSHNTNPESLDPEVEQRSTQVL